MTVLPESEWPLSRHDLDVLLRELHKARMAGRQPSEVIVSSKRIHTAGVTTWGLMVRPNDEAPLNEALLVIPDQEPIPFSFESDD